MRSSIARIAVIAVSFFAMSSNAQENYLDSTFGNGGIVSTALFQPKAMTLQQDGKILVTGETSIWRFNPNGAPDAGFGIQGKVDVMPMGVTNMASIAQLENGQLLAMGTSNAKYAFIRLNTDGSTDTTFGNNGVKIVAQNFTIFGYWDTPCKMVVLPNGKIMLTGRNTAAMPGIWDVYVTKAVIARYNADLSPDLTFNTTGFVKFGVGQGPFQVKDIAVYDDGRAILGLQAGGNVKLYRFLLNGQSDSTFGSSGSQVIDLGSNDDRLNSIAITPEGKLLISGSKPDGFHSAVVYRTLPNGTIDTTYGDAGIFMLPNASGYNESTLQSLILNDNRVISGIQKWNDAMDFGLLFTNPDGTIDAVSGNDGKIITPLNGPQNLTCIAQQPDGKIVAAGFGENMIMMRYDISGALKTPSFDERKIKFYPNPVTDEVNVTGLPQGTVIALCNISGQKLLEATANGETAIDISGLAEGMYFLNTGRGSAKIIKK